MLRMIDMQSTIDRILQDKDDFLITNRFGLDSSAQLLREPSSAVTFNVLQTLLSSVSTAQITAK